MIALAEARARFARATGAFHPMGQVLEITGMVIAATLDGARIGDVVEIETAQRPLPCEVIGFRGQTLLAIPLEPIGAIAPGAPVRPVARLATVPVGDSLLGRLIDPFGRPLDGRPAPAATARVRLDAPGLPIEQRAEVEARFDTGVRAIDGMLTCGRGQRVGIFAGAGCGKSMLVEQIAAQSAADVVVVGLIGERGREVRELLGAARRREMVIVAATADRSPLERVRGAMAATAIAEHFRDRGKNVLLVLDSLTRFAMALRELGLAAGEAPATKGYPPSVFATLPRLLERCAPRAGGGAITGFYTVLVEGDDLADPIADAARSLLDAHVILSRELAGRGHFPAIDILASASRVALRVCERRAIGLAARARDALARRRHVAELQALGAYTGGNAGFDAVLATGERIDMWARQGRDVRAGYAETLRGLAAALPEEAA